MWNIRRARARKHRDYVRLWISLITTPPLAHKARDITMQNAPKYRITMQFAPHSHGIFRESPNPIPIGFNAHSNTIHLETQSVLF